MSKVTQIRIDTFVEIFACDPLPTSWIEQRNGMLREEIVEDVAKKYGKDLNAVVIYDQNVINVDGVLYTSAKLNVQPWVPA